jgi:cytochrome c551/c552
MERLATDKGCYLCHRAEVPRAREGALLPYAPSWVEIARKYRGQNGAEDRLTAIVLGGSDPKDRHWRGKVSDAQMPPNVPEIDETQARQLVRWILSFRS